MKTTISHSAHSSAGYALLMVMGMAAVCLLAAAATMNRLVSSTNINDRNKAYSGGLYAAEAATEKIVARMRYDYMVGSDTLVTNNVGLYRSYIPSTTEDPFWGKFEFSDGLGNLNQAYVQCISNRIYTPLQSQYAGLCGWRTVYRVLANVRSASELSGVTNAVQQDMEIDSVPVFQFAIFYNGLMEFTWAAPLTVRGRTHANGHIFVGSSSPLTFNDLVTTAGQIIKTNWDGHTLSQYTGGITYAPTINGGFSMNVPVLQLPIGTNNTPAAVREIINLPPGGENPNSVLGQQRYFNMPGIDLLVSNTTITVLIKGSTADPSPTKLTSTNTLSALATNFPFLSLTNTFTDQREAGKTVLATQIDVAKYGRWLLTNSYVASRFPFGSGIYPNILYVADNRTNTSTQLTAVRLVNGSVVPTNGTTQPTGFTVATPNPLYVWGNYNCPDPGALGTTNTAGTFPSALVSDALTVLSPNWQDSHSNDSFNTGVRVASSTTINAAILTGIVYSSATTPTDTTHFSGGVMNLPRLLEDWGNGGSTALTLNTSIVNFYNSVRATNQFQNPGVYYYAPTRQFNFDTKFKSASSLPPGTPLLGALMRAKWNVPPPGTVTYYGP